MTGGEEKFTTIRISKTSFEKIFVLKRNFELRDKKEHSYDDVISKLLALYEGLKID